VFQICTDGEEQGRLYSEDPGVDIELFTTSKRVCVYVYVKESLTRIDWLELGSHFIYAARHAILEFLGIEALLHITHIHGF
jgi:hypothetical protein